MVNGVWRKVTYECVHFALLFFFWVIFFFRATFFFTFAFASLPVFLFTCFPVRLANRPTG